MKKLRILLIVCFSVFICNLLFAQETKLDSLLLKLKREKADSSKANLYFLIGEEYKLFDPDSAVYFYNLSLLNSKSFKSISNYNIFTAQNLSSLGWVYCTYKGNCDTSVILINKSLYLYSKLLNSVDKTIAKVSKKGIASCYSRLGVVNSSQGIYDKAIENFLKSLRISEELKDLKALATCYNNIGISYFNQNLYDKSLEFYNKSLKIRKEFNDTSGILTCYNNIGLILSDKDYYKKFKPEKRDSILNTAISQFQKSIDYSKKINDKQRLALCYSNMANITFDQVFYCKTNKNEQKGLINITFQYYNKALNIYKELGDKNGTSVVLACLSEFNNDIADSLAVSKAEKNKYLKDAIKYGEEAVKIAGEIKAINIIRQTSLFLKTTYETIGNTRQALKYANIYMDLNDTMFNTEKTQAFAEMEAKYKAEKKQLEIDKLHKQKALDKETIARKEAENNKQKVISYTFIFGFLIILIFVFVVLRLFIQKKKANIILSKQYVEIHQKNEEIISQRDEIEAQRDKLTIQNELLTEQKKAITDSINYAKRIQDALLHDVNNINGSQNISGFNFESFILFKPKDVVSGDFYWTAKIYNGAYPIIVIAVADCTGHGVPGAFMSMLGISFLNEIVRKQEINQANLILNELRKEIINALQQKGVSGEQKDGMDISLLVLNTETNECQWAGANNPLYIISSVILNDNEESGSVNKRDYSLFAHEIASLSSSLITQNDNRKLIEIKGNKMPIAIYPNMTEFTNHLFKAEKGDCLYLFSDGYADQFGGIDGRKFFYKQFKELLLTNCQSSMQKQKEILENTLIVWIGNREQVDDITVLGIRI